MQKVVRMWCVCAYKANVSFCDISPVKTGTRNEQEEIRREERLMAPLRFDHMTSRLCGRRAFPTPWCLMFFYNLGIYTYLSYVFFRPKNACKLADDLAKQHKTICQHLMAPEYSDGYIDNSIAGADVRTFSEPCISVAC